MSIKKLLERSVVLLLVIFILIPIETYCQTISDTVKKIDAIFSEFNERSPGAAIRVSRGNQILFSKGFGMSDLEHNMRITDSTIFEAGSVSKQFTATSILLLVLQGKVELDDDVRKYIPELPIYEKEITIRHLLNHTSGIRDWGSVASLAGWPRGTKVYTNKMALKYIVKQEGLNNMPGDEYLYSNSNYTLLTFIVERVSGMSLAEFTKKNIFEPLGMKSTQWRTNFREIVNERAVGYDRKNTTFLNNMPFENTYGHAALLTNVKDLDVWNKSWKKSPLGGSELKNLREKQGVLNNGQEISYASGVMINTFNGHREVSHSGATAGYRCWLAFYPVDNLSIVYLSNATYFPTVATGRKISEVFFGEEKKALGQEENKDNSEQYMPKTGDLMKLAGDYHSNECDGNYSIYVKDGKLWVNDHVRKNVALVPIDENLFESRGVKYLFKSYGDTKYIFVSVTRAKNVKFVSK